ncbi:hypothetical protein ACUW97_000263 [Kocuria rhizophila]|nr:Uncharacterised protein [Kocuria rhizophila]
MRPIRVSRWRIAATAAASGTRIIRSIAEPMKLGPTRCRPMPSIRDPSGVVTEGPCSRQAGRKAEFSGSATHTPVWRPV